MLLNNLVDGIILENGIPLNDVRITSDDFVNFEAEFDVGDYTIRFNVVSSSANYVKLYGIKEKVNEITITFASLDEDGDEEYGLLNQGITFAKTVTATIITLINYYTVKYKSLVGMVIFTASGSGRIKTYNRISSNLPSLGFTDISKMSTSNPKKYYMFVRNDLYNKYTDEFNRILNDYSEDYFSYSW